MWVIRFLNGPLAGQIVNLKEGGNTLGRTSSCDIVLSHPGVSKQHCKIDVLQNEILIVDLDSRNGTFVNGLKIKSHRLSMGDKLSFNDVVAELLEVPQDSVHFLRGQQSSRGAPHHQAHHMGGQYHGNAAINMDQHEMAGEQMLHDQEPDATVKSPPKKGLAGIIQIAQNYLEEVVLPGVYKLTEVTEFKNVILIFLGLFIFLVTSLSTIPLVRILKSSIEQESQRRALTIARVLSTVNRPKLIKGTEAAVSVDFAQREAGVLRAYIVSNVDRRIIAPASLAGRTPNDKFVNTAFQMDKEQVNQIDSSTIGAVVPIKFYNPNTGTQSTMAYSVVMYDMGALAVDDGRTISLFVQTLFIALLVGFIIFYFMYRLFEYPILSLNKQLDTALRDGHSEVHVKFRQESIQQLISNVSSILTRIDTSGSGSEGPQIEQDRSMEMANIVQLIGFPAMAIQGHDLTVASVNSSFEEKTGLNSNDLVFARVDNITDQSLKLSIEDLLERVNEMPDQMATNELDFGGIKHEIIAQAVMGADKISYFIVVILPIEEEDDS